MIRPNEAAPAAETEKEVACGVEYFRNDHWRSVVRTARRPRYLRQCVYLSDLEALLSALPDNDLQEGDPLSALRQSSLANHLTEFEREFELILMHPHAC
jgi:hypothetical protein